LLQPGAGAWNDGGRSRTRRRTYIGPVCAGLIWAKRDHEFESALLQRRVSCEPDLLGPATRAPKLPVIRPRFHHLLAASAIPPPQGAPNPYFPPNSRETDDRASASCAGRPFASSKKTCSEIESFLVPTGNYCAVFTGSSRRTSIRTSMSRCAGTCQRGRSVPRLFPREFAFLMGKTPIATSLRRHTHRAGGSFVYDKRIEALCRAASGALQSWQRTRTKKTQPRNSTPNLGHRAASDDLASP
jgi:hypothetical protein